MTSGHRNAIRHAGRTKRMPSRAASGARMTAACTTRAWIGSPSNDPNTGASSGGHDRGRGRFHRTLSRMAHSWHDDVRLAHVLADNADNLSMDRFGAIDLQ